MMTVLCGLLVAALGGFAALRPEAAAVALRVDPAGTATNSVRYLGATMVAVGLLVVVWM